MPATAVLPHIVTLGCRLNIAESETIRTAIGPRDMIVVNSCAVTNAAVKQTRVAIRRARRDRPNAELVVTGCAAQIDPAGFAAMPEVDRVVGNLDKAAPHHWGSAPATPRAAALHARAFVAVQTGCDHGCTFCAIPAGRGTSRSMPMDGIVAQIAALAAAGQAEVVLTGVDVTSYGADLPGTPVLGDLVAAILARTAIPRLRLSSIDAIEIDPVLFEIVTSEARVMPHLHLSLQAGDDMILKRMKRRHLRGDAVRLVQRLKARRDIAIGADLIAGFPTETDAMALNSLDLLDDCDVVHAHIFPYSPRADTPAARMPQVPAEVARARASRLRERAAARHSAWLASHVGTVQHVVIEKPGDRGHAEGFAQIRLPQTPPRAEPVEAPSFPSDENSPSTISGRTGFHRIGTILPVRVTHAAADHLTGIPE